MEDKEQVEDQAAKETKTDDSNLEETASDSKSVICQKEENDSVKDKNESIGKAWMFVSQRTMIDNVKVIVRRI